MEFNGEDVMNEYDCPLYTLTDNILCLLSSTVYASVSFIYQVVLHVFLLRQLLDSQLNARVFLHHTLHLSMTGQTLFTV